MLSRISDAGLSLNYKKCAFNRTSTTFSGYKVENGKVLPDPSRTDWVDYDVECFENIKRSINDAVLVLPNCLTRYCGKRSVSYLLGV